MRIPCPCCGLRDAGEFSFLGDAKPIRPDGMDVSFDAMTDYVYLRDNPAGVRHELCYHGYGCRSWLVVERDTRTHCDRDRRLGPQCRPRATGAGGGRIVTLALDRSPAHPSAGRTDPAQSFRTAAGGTVLDRTQALSFRFDGRAYAGVAGDTLASALLANGVRLVGRSFKYHRPRGILSAGSEEPNALVELRTGARREPNTRATVAELYEGLEAASQNRWPSLRFDALSINAALAPIFAAGFYYKTFMWPRLSGRSSTSR